MKNLNATGNLTLAVPRVYGHSAYFTTHLSQPMPTADGLGLASGCTFNGGPLCGNIAVPPAATSDWVDVGAFMDVYNHGGLQTAAKRPQTGCKPAATCPAAPRCPALRSA